jgi:hypothetical protein
MQTATRGQVLIMTALEQVQIKGSQNQLVYSRYMLEDIDNIS